MLDLRQFFRHSNASEDWLARYVVTEAQRGRRISEVLQDRAVLRHSDASTRARVLDRSEVIEALAENAVARVHAEIARGDGVLGRRPRKMVDRYVRDVLGGCEPSSARTQGALIVDLWARPRAVKANALTAVRRRLRFTQTPDARCDGSQPQPHQPHTPPPTVARPGARDLPINHLG